MLIFVEFMEFIRALNFPGSDIFIAAAVGALFLIVLRVKIRPHLWCVYGYLVIVPILYSFVSKRVELGIMGLTIAIFFFFSHCRKPYLPSLKNRSVVFTVLVFTSYVFSIGDAVYAGSNFNSPFVSGNAFINYLLIYACILAFRFRGVLQPAIVSLPLLMIQTKSVVVLFFSNVRFLVFVSMLSVPAVLILGVALFDRVGWMLEQRGLIYALGAGRVERLVSKISDSFSWDRAILGAPFEIDIANFEIEFIDVFLDFGLLYTLVLYSASIYLIRRLSGRLFYKILVVFLVLNLGGHFWNNTIVVIAFLVLVFYANSYNYKHVP